MGVVADNGMGVSNGHHFYHPNTHQWSEFECVGRSELDSNNVFPANNQLRQVRIQPNSILDPSSHLMNDQQEDFFQGSTNAGIGDQSPVALPRLRSELDSNNVFPANNQLRQVRIQPNSILDPSSHLMNDQQEVFFQGSTNAGIGDQLPVALPRLVNTLPSVSVRDQNPIIVSGAVNGIQMHSAPLSESKVSGVPSLPDSSPLVTSITINGSQIHRHSPLPPAFNIKGGNLKRKNVGRPSGSKKETRPSLTVAESTNAEKRLKIKNLFRKTAAVDLCTDVEDSASDAPETKFVLIQVSTAPKPPLGGGGTRRSCKAEKTKTVTIYGGPKEEDLLRTVKHAMTALSREKPEGYRLHQLHDSEDVDEHFLQLETERKMSAVKLKRRAQVTKASLEE